MTSIDQQLAPVAEAMARELHTGAGLLEALAVAGDGAGGAIGRDIARVVDLVESGETTADVLRGWARHRRSPQLAVLVTLLVVGHESGGDLSVALESFAEGRRDADDLAGELRALTSQAQASAGFLVGLPVVAVIGLGVIEPATASFLVGTFAGRCCVVVAVTLDTAAWWVMRRLVAGVS